MVGAYRPLLLGLDIGSSSSKGILASTDGRIVARVERPHGLSLPRPGWAEHDADDVWLADARSIIRELTSADLGTVVGLASSGIGPCVLPVDEQYNALRPAILYGIDTRATKEIDELNGQLGRDTILRRAGSSLTSQAVGPKLLWLRHHEPDVWSRTRRFMMASSFLVHWLTGEYVLDHHSASQCDPMYDLSEGAWASDWVDQIAPGLELPRLLWPGDVAGYVTAFAAEETGLSAGTPVLAGTIDAWAEAISVGVRVPGDMMLMYGTTMFMVEIVDRIVPNPTIWGTAGVSPGSYTLAAGTATSGALGQWFRGIAGDVTFEDLSAEADGVAPGADGLIVLPYFAGERTPLFDPDARGMILGLTLRHGRGHLFRALLEGTAFAARHILDAFTEAGTTPSRIVAVGGGTALPTWMRIVSDVTGMTQEVPRETIGAAYGDALLAAIAVGVTAPATTWSEGASVISPDLSHKGLYDDLYGVYRSLYPATLEQAHQLAAIAGRAGAELS